MPTKGQVRDLTNKRFGRITVIKLSHINKNAYWVCECDCGKRFIASGNNLVRGKQISYGCYKKEMLSKACKKHGDSGSRFYHIWFRIKDRVLNKNDARY